VEGGCVGSEFDGSLRCHIHVEDGYLDGIFEGLRASVFCLVGSEQQSTNNTKMVNGENNFYGLSREIW
jgi:hypothetical protein